MLMNTRTNIIIINEGPLSMMSQNVEARRVEEIKNGGIRWEVGKVY